MHTDFASSLKLPSYVPAAASSQFCFAQAVSASPQWQGWGKDNNSLCSSAQTSTYQELLCEPAYPGSFDANQHAWTGVTCTPAGQVLCLNLAGWGLQGNISILNDLAPLQHLQMISMASNSLTGECCVFKSSIMQKCSFRELQTW